MEQSACYNNIYTVDSGEGQSTSAPSPNAMVKTFALHTFLFFQLYKKSYCVCVCLTLIVKNKNEMHRCFEIIVL